MAHEEMARQELLDRLDRAMSLLSPVLSAALKAESPDGAQRVAKHRAIKKLRELMEIEANGN